MRKCLSLGIAVVALVATAADIDVGRDALMAAPLLEGLPHGSPSGWIRLRGLSAPAVAGDELGTREALLGFRNHGLRTCVLMRLAGDSRLGYLPTDLQQAYENSRKLGAAYGDLVDAWEIDNEPDLGFVPESAERFTAFLKANYLGFQRGLAERKQTRSASPAPGVTSPILRPPCVLMGSLGLPPGPWLERFIANDGLSYTGGFNYHYYGYADDFTGVYRQFEMAVQELSSAGNTRSTANTKKTLPVFLTEIGYGMLGQEARNTKEGRLRQWQWFKSVGSQANALAIKAPMAFYLPPYLEYGTLEFGLTVDLGELETGNRKPEGWIAGGIGYEPRDFGASAPEPWMEMIGKDLGGHQITPALAQWLATRETGRASGPSRAWTVESPPPSPIVIDFLPGESLAFIKRYNGSFVTSKVPLKVPAETGLALDGKGPTPAGTAAPVEAPKTVSPVPPPRSEEIMVHVRTTNGNLYEVYPTRRATPSWEQYLEPAANFTMSFYGRAELPWRFADNRPASLVIVMYPKQLPAKFEFRRPRLVQIGVPEKPEGTKRFGRGQVVLYNFSDQPVAGQLGLPKEMHPVAGTPATVTLAPGERRVVDVVVEVPAEGFRRVEASIEFVPADRNVPAARHVTMFIPDIAGMATRVVADLLGAPTQPGDRHRAMIETRPRATEEAMMTLASESPRLVAYAQAGASVTETADGFAVTVTASPPGKPQRAEVEIPWPEGVVFRSDEFLSLEYRLWP